MNFEWDDNKARNNLKKHRVDFADAVAAFEDESALTIAEPNSQEDRYVTMALDGLGRVLVVVYTWRDNSVRIISARKAGPTEYHQYFANRLSMSERT